MQEAVERAAWPELPPGDPDGSTAPAATAAVPEARHDQVIYLYGILEPGGEAGHVLKTGGVPGLEPGEPLFGIEAGGLLAAVSHVPAATFQEAPLNALLSNLTRLAPYAVRHEEAVRSLLPAARSLIPMAFGSVHSSHQHVIAALIRRSEELHTVLERLRGRREWSLNVLRDAARLQAEAEACSQELVRLAQEAAAASPGRAYLLRKRREHVLVLESERLERGFLEEITTALSELSADSVQERPAAQVSEGRELLLRASFLVDLASTDAFLALVEELKHRYAWRGLGIENSGPWAPYSFTGKRRATG